jgi:hypothetical protein
MRRCGCTACLLEAALLLLNTGRVGMGILLVEQALEQAGRRTAAHAKPPARVRRARARP